MKRQPSEWEEIIANETTDKELISKIYKQLMEKAMATHSSILAWRIPWTEEPDSFLVHGVSRVGLT